jgi:hypothetical protein
LSECGRRLHTAEDRVVRMKLQMRAGTRQDAATRAARRTPPSETRMRRGPGSDGGVRSKRLHLLGLQPEQAGQAHPGADEEEEGEQPHGETPDAALRRDPDRSFPALRQRRLDTASPDPRRRGRWKASRSVPTGSVTGTERAESAAGPVAARPAGGGMSRSPAGPTLHQRRREHWIRATVAS